MEKDLDLIRIKMKALGLSERQIQSIIEECLCGKSWDEIEPDRKEQVLRSLEARILFARKFFKLLNCDTCWK